jgi:hypothetical protein
MAAGLPICGPGELLLPETVHITPSNINPWRGVRRPESRYTQDQLRMLHSRGDDPDTVEDVIVRQSASRRERWWPGPNAPVFLMPCPVIQRRRSGEQLLVITPAGHRKWVYADGAITKGKRWSK